MMSVIVKFEGKQPLCANKFIDGNQLLFSVTMLILLSSTIAEVNASERFLEIKF